jgi:hypothetical protein
LNYDLVHRLTTTIEENRDGHDYTYSVFIDQLGVNILRTDEVGNDMILRLTTENARALAEQLKDAAIRRDCT